jgi:hypothetical protein
MNPLPQVFDASTQTWRSLSNAQRELPFYPFMFLAPNGKVFMAGPEATSRYLSTLGFGQLEDVARSQFSFRDYGSSLMYDAGKIMILGGSPGVGGQGSPTNTVEIIDLNQDQPQWRSAQSMKHPRRMQSAAALPDGTVLVTGGTSAAGFNDASGSVLEPELYNPKTNQWTALREMSERRIYHSIALLLPDARVLVAGGGQPFGTGLPPGQEDHHRSAQIFSPPYLFKGGTRPELRSVPGTIGYGQSFSVETDDAKRIRMVRLMRLGSITHAFDHNARSIELEFQVAGNGTLSVATPTSPFIAPPGDYMIFLVDDRGVPSNATKPNGNIVRVAPSTGPFCDVSVQTTFDGTQPGDTVAIAGDGPELGNGDPFSSRLRLSADGTFPRWTGTFKLTQKRDYNYRLAVLKADRGNFTFEYQDDRMRTLSVPEQDGCKVSVDLRFGN